MSVIDVGSWEIDPSSWSICHTACRCVSSLLFLSCFLFFFFSVSGILHNHCAQFCQLATKYPRKETTREFDLKLIAKRKRQSCRREKWSEVFSDLLFYWCKILVNMYVFYCLSFSVTFVFLTIAGFHPFIICACCFLIVILFIYRLLSDSGIRKPVSLTVISHASVERKQ